MVELKSKSRKKAEVDEILTEIVEDVEMVESIGPEPLPEGNIGFLLKRWQPWRKQKYVKQKIKKVQVRADSLAKLIYAVQEVWMSLIEFKSDREALTEFEEFLSRNNIPLDENFYQRMKLLKTKLF